jgi:hypothetical protein
VAASGTRTSGPALRPRLDRVDVARITRIDANAQDHVRPKAADVDDVDCPSRSDHGVAVGRGDLQPELDDDRALRIERSGQHGATRDDPRANVGEPGWRGGALPLPPFESQAPAVAPNGDRDEPCHGYHRDDDQQQLHDHIVTVHAGPDPARRCLTILVAVVTLSLGACTASSDEPDATSSSPSTPTADGSASSQGAPCDPGLGAPKPSSSCPSDRAQTAWLTRGTGGELALVPMRILGNDVQGKRYAAKHDLEFPFPNDSIAIPTGASRAVTLAPDTVCTSAALVKPRRPLTDHVVPCPALTAVAAQQGVLVAVWSDADRVVQVSELYRP